MASMSHPSTAGKEGGGGGSGRQQSPSISHVFMDKQKELHLAPQLLAGSMSGEQHGPTDLCLPPGKRCLPKLLRMFPCRSQYMGSYRWILDRT